MSQQNRKSIARLNHLVLEQITSGPFEVNAYLVTCPVTGESTLVDAPHQLDDLIQELKNLNLKQVLLTHSHPDHIGSLSEIVQHTGVPVAVNQNDDGNLPFSPDFYLKDGDTITTGNLELKVLHTPGHTPGSVCFKLEDYLISGDTIFPGGPGKTGTPEDFRKILDSLKNNVFTLPGNMLVFPGHGDSTSIGKEKEQFEAFQKRHPQPELCGDVTWLS